MSGMLSLQNSCEVPQHEDLPEWTTLSTRALYRGRKANNTLWGGVNVLNTNTFWNAKEMGFELNLLSS